MGYSPWGHKELGTTKRLTHPTDAATHHRDETHRHYTKPKKPHGIMPGIRLHLCEFRNKQN